MASFDFIDVSAKGYAFVWSKKAYLAKLAFPVIFVKIACLLAIFVLGAQDLYLRQGLISMPAYIIEAIFVIGVIRYIVYKEPIFIWGKYIAAPESSSPPAPYQGSMSKKQAVQGGIAIYLLMRVIEAVITGWENSYVAASKSLETKTATTSAGASPSPAIEQATPIDPMNVDFLPLALTMFLMFISLLIFIWSFRFFWLFIPVTMGYSFSDFLKRTLPFKTSLTMISTWFFCSLPLVLLYAIALEVFTGALEEGSALNVIIQALLQSIIEIIVVLVQVSAMTYGVIHILSGKVLRK